MEKTDRRAWHWDVPEVFHGDGLVFVATGEQGRWLEPDAARELARRLVWEADVAARSRPDPPA